MPFGQAILVIIWTAIAAALILVTVRAGVRAFNNWMDKRDL